MFLLSWHHFSTGSSWHRYSWKVNMTWHILASGHSKELNIVISSQKIHCTLTFLKTATGAAVQGVWIVGLKSNLTWIWNIHSYLYKCCILFFLYRFTSCWLFKTQQSSQTCLPWKWECCSGTGTAWMVTFCTTSSTWDHRGILKFYEIVSADWNTTWCTFQARRKVP